MNDCDEDRSYAVALEKRFCRQGAQRRCALTPGVQGVEPPAGGRGGVPLGRSQRCAPTPFCRSHNAQLRKSCEEGKSWTLA